MKMHTTNYLNTFIEVAPDTKATRAEIPPVKTLKTAARFQYEMVREHPFQFTSDEVIFGFYAYKNDVAPENLTQEKQRFFSKGQACLRASALCKRYGWGIVSDALGRIALVGMEDESYSRLALDPGLAHTSGMRSSKT